MTTGTPPPTDAPALPTNAPAASVPAVPGPPPAPGVPGTPPPGAPLPPVAGPLPPAEGPVPPAEGIGARGARRWSVRPWRGAWLAVAGALCAALPFAHPLLPNSLGNLGSLVETFLPWTVALLLPLTLFGLYRRAPLVLFGVVLVAVAWPVRFGGTLVDKQEAGGELIVVSHNVGEDNLTPRAPPAGSRTPAPRSSPSRNWPQRHGRRSTAHCPPATPTTPSTAGSASGARTR